MGLLDHWHPVLLTRELGDAPARVRLGGHAIALFRAGARVGALDDRCPHRGMSLACGRVEGDRLVCAYHGWAYGADGSGCSPGTPRLQARTRHYDVLERYGAIWLKAAGAVARFPAVGGLGHAPVTTLRHRILAPLELVLDNFTEVEHTGEVHGVFGYDTAAMHAVTTRVEATDDAVRVVNRGPQRPMPRLLRRLVGIGPEDHFVDDWTTRFSPVHVVYDQYWIDPRTEIRRPRGLHVAVVLTPVEEELTDLYTFVYANTASVAGLGVDALLGPVLRAFVNLEVRLDAHALERMADRDRGLRGHKLARFDRVLGEHRRRLARLYYGEAAGGAAGG